MLLSLQNASYRDFQVPSLPTFKDACPAGKKLKGGKTKLMKGKSQWLGKAV
jgi:hypothetical protein